MSRSHHQLLYDSASLDSAFIHGRAQRRERLSLGSGLTPLRPAVKMTVCQPHHVVHTVGVCQKHNSSYTRSMKDRADTLDNMQASG